MSRTTPFEANQSLLRRVRESAGGKQEWEFSCECRAEDCRALVFLTLDAYIALHDHGGVVLAEGHQPSQVERARVLRTESEALTGQADHQVKRALKNLRASLVILRSRRPGR